MSTTKYSIVPIAEALSKRGELEINGLAINLSNEEATSAQSPNNAKRGRAVFEVSGLKPGHRAWIVQESNVCQLMQEKRGLESEWLGEYPSVDAALRALANKMSV